MKGRVEKEFIIVDEKFKDRSMSMLSTWLLFESGCFSFAMLDFLSFLVLLVGALLV